MRRYILTMIIILSSIVTMITTEANACVNEFPVPDIELTNNSDTQYKIINETVVFDGSGSFDPDLTPNITKWQWQFYYYSGYHYLEELTAILETPTHSQAFDEPGKYIVALWVRGDDGEDDWNPDSYDDTAKCTIYALDSHFTSDATDIAYGTGTTFRYTLYPTFGWEPSIFQIFIKDSSDNYAYKFTQFGTVHDISLDSSLNWNGLGNYGSYDGNPLPPGTYTATLLVNKSGSVMQKDIEIKIYGVTDVQWVTYGTNITLDDCPAPNGGKAIFPDRLFPADDYTDRRKVYIEATITPPLPNKDVYFSWWDVDDPSTDNWPIDNNGSAGNDNFGTGESLNKTSEKTDSNGKARVIFTVTMRPGDNYRIATSTSQTQLSQMNLTMANNNSPPTGVMLSSMLTTWRVLHVEFDTMEDPPSNEPFGMINRTSEAIFPNTLVDDGTAPVPNWPTNSLIGSVLKRTGTNAMNYVDPFNLNPLARLYDIASNTSYQVTIVTDYTTDLFDNDTLNGPDDAAETSYMALCNPSNLPYSINTDDQPLSIPNLSTIITGMNYYFNEAYIYVVDDYALNINDTFPWQRNSDCITEQLAYVDIPGNSGYWTVCVGFGYEETTYAELGRHPSCAEPHQCIMGDDDPENEGVAAGCASCFYGHVGDSYYNIPGDKCMIYLENMRDKNFTNYANVVTHEVGHLLGLQHQPYEGGTPNSYEYGLMGFYGTDTYINSIGCYIAASAGLPGFEDYFSGLNIRYLRQYASDKNP